MYEQVFLHPSLAICCPYAGSSLLLDPGYTELDKSRNLNNDSKMFPGSQPFLGLTAPLRNWHTKTTEYNCRDTILQLGVFQNFLKSIQGGLEPLVLGQRELRGVCQLITISLIANRCCLLPSLALLPQFKKFLISQYYLQYISLLKAGFLLLLESRSSAPLNSLVGGTAVMEEHLQPVEPRHLFLSTSHLSP